MLVPADAPVMIVGESGTGKELIARSIHEAGARLLSPFIAYNCAAIPRDLMESIFFGHVRGAFTGAVRNMPGLFRQADQGTLFLDEIAELDMGLQAKLLRVIEDGVIRPLGSEEEFRVDVRLIAATSRDIRAAVRDGRFREELYYRINVIELPVPPLRERPEDIPVLVEHFLRKHGTGRPDGRQVTLTKDAIAYLQTLPWPGNVRELENLVRRVLVLCEPGPIDAQRVSGLVSPAPDSVATARIPMEPVESPAELAELNRAQDDVERQTILGALHRARGNQTRAARMLGVHRNVLLRRMEKLGIASE
jgi:serine/threonine-protein kinase PknK